LNLLPLVLVASVIAPLAGAITGVFVTRRANAQQAGRRLLGHAVAGLVLAGLTHAPFLLVPAGGPAPTTAYFALAAASAYFSSAALLGGGIGAIQTRTRSFVIAAITGLFAILAASFALNSLG
jgi:hypothetical protein